MAGLQWKAAVHREDLKYELKGRLNSIAVVQTDIAAVEKELNEFHLEEKWSQQVKNLEEHVQDVSEEFQKEGTVDSFEDVLKALRLRKINLEERVMSLQEELKKWDLLMKCRDAD